MQFLLRLFRQETACGKGGKHVAQGDTALRTFFARLVEHLNGGVRFLKADVGGFRGHTALLQRHFDGGEFRGTRLTRRGHDVHHARHFRAGFHRVVKADAVLVHGGGQNLGRRHTVTTHQFAGGGDTVAHRLQSLGVFAEFGRQLRKQQLVTLDSLRGVDTESLCTAAGVALNLFQAVTHDTRDGTQIVHLAVKRYARRRKAAQRVVELAYIVTCQIPDCKRLTQFTEPAVRTLHGGIETACTLGHSLHRGGKIAADIKLVVEILHNRVVFTILATCYFYTVLNMESILIFIGKWFVMLPICIGIVIMPFYLLGAFARAAFKDFRRASRAGITPKHSR